MSQRNWITMLTACVSSLVFGTVSAQATDISGVISTTLTIVDNSRLVGDVQCLQLDNGPCISLGAPGIKLDLNGFSITGPADPPANCTSAPADGIAAVGQDKIEIRGPGVIQKFKRRGISLVQLSNATVRGVVVQHNCSTGVMLRFVSDSLVEEVVAARNGVASGTSTDGGTNGGIRVSSSYNNQIRRSELSGNGSTARPDDFGVGLVGDSSGNTLEENGIGGNVNGLQLAAATVGNVIRRNLIAGNPPAQLGSVGVDIRDLSPAGANTIEESLCITYSGASPSPCPNRPQFSGHHNK